MREKYNWNPVFNLIMEIKDEFLKIEKDINYNFEDEENTTTLEVMINKINKTKYSEWLRTIKISQNKTLFLIRYNLITAAEEMWSNPNSINREARSIVIDLNREEIVLCPIKKFFNLDEIPETSLEKVLELLKTAKKIEITNKLDSSMQSAGWYQDYFVLCGSQGCDRKKAWRVDEGIKYIENHENYLRMLKENPDETFMFEFVHPDDKHIVEYNDNESGLYLLCTRNKYTGEEYSYERMKNYANKYKVLSTDIEDLSFEELLNLKDKFNAREKEGWVIKIDDLRIKLKTDDYTKIHKAYSSKSLTKLLIRSIADGSIDDVYASIPEGIKEKAKMIITDIFSHINEEEQKIKRYYNSIPNNYLHNKKEFSLYIKDNIPKEYLGYMFSMYNNQEINILKHKNRYKKPEEIGLKNYYLFDK